MAARARDKPYTQLPIQSFSETDTIGDVLSILRELELGQFRRAALLMDAMDRDDRIRAVMDTRNGALKATPIDVKPSGEDATAKKLAEQLGGVDDSPGEWDRIFPESLVGELNRWGNGLGIGVAEAVWTTTKKEGWRPRLRLWHPQFVRWDWGTFRYRILTAEGEIPLPDTDENRHSDGRWILHCPYGYQYAWLRGLLRALAPKYVMRGWNYRDWARYNELHGQGLVKAITPSGTKREDHEDFFNAVVNRGAEPVILCEQGEEGNQYDIALVEAQGKQQDSFKDFKIAIDTDIAILYLGQNLTTESPSGGSSSKSLGQIQDLVRRDRLKADAGIAVTFRDQVLVPWAAFDYGDGDLAPRPVYQTEPEKDKLAEATALKTLGDALTSLQLASKRIDIDGLVDEQGLPVKSEEQIAAEEAVAAEEEAARQAAQPTPGGPAKQPPGQQPNQGPPPVKARRAALGAGAATNIRKTFAGLPIVVENPANSVRIWREDGPSGRTIGTTKMLHDYGFIEGHMGADDEDVDVYLGPEENAPDVHVVHQSAAPDYARYDEDKIFLGFPSADAARAAYVAHRNDGNRAIQGMSSMPLETFKRKLRRREGSGKIRATAHADTVAAIMKLANKATALRTAGNSRYADRLTDNAIRLAGRTLAVDVALLRHQVQNAKSLPDLLDQLVALYKAGKMERAKLAKVIEKTRLMSRLAGMASVHKEVHAR